MSNETESKIIELFKKTHAPAGKSQYVGIGDDAAVLPHGLGESQLITTDLLAEGVHFFREKSSARDIGYKALAVNVSDIAAMGGTAREAFLSIALPKECRDLVWITAFSEGLHDAAKMFGVTIFGGDTTSSSGGIYINISLLGYTPTNHVKLRSGARPGDLIAVVGPLGDSRAGLSIILEESMQYLQTAQSLCLVQQHYRPHPQLESGQFLGSLAGVTAMMDISDGLDTDLRKLADASSCGADIKIDTLPVSGELVAWCAERKEDVYNFAAIGGEDYALLFTFSPDCLPEIQSGLQQIQSGLQDEVAQPFSVIGRTTNSRVVRYLREGNEVSLSGQAFSHF